MLSACKVLPSLEQGEGEVEEEGEEQTRSSYRYLQAASGARLVNLKQD